MPFALTLAMALAGTRAAVAQSAPALDEPPLLAPPPPPGLTLPAGGIAAVATLEVGVSEGSAFAPTSIAPDLSYGLTGDLTLSVVHSGVATTGLRGNTGRGLCLTGTDDGCPRLYDRAGVEVLYGLRRGPLAIAPLAGVHLWSIDAGWVDVKLGLRARQSWGKVVAMVNPSVFIAVNDRNGGNPDSCWLPASIGYKVAPPLTLSIGGGAKLPDLGQVGDTWLLTVGLIAQYAVGPALAVGSSFFLGEIAGAGAYPDEAVGPERRYFQAWVAYNR